MKRIYALLAVLGLIVPYYFFVRFLDANGLNLPLFVQQLFANDIATFFAVDLIIATVVFWLFVFQESRHYPIRYWWVGILASLVVGLSFALPLFLYLRESAKTRDVTGRVI
jgi:hypothetical protein